MEETYCPVDASTADAALRVRQHNRVTSMRIVLG